MLDGSTTNHTLSCGAIGNPMSKAVVDGMVALLWQVWTMVLSFQAVGQAGPDSLAKAPLTRLADSSLTVMFTSTGDAASSWMKTSGKFPGLHHRFTSLFVVASSMVMVRLPGSWTREGFSHVSPSPALVPDWEWLVPADE